MSANNCRQFDEPEEDLLDLDITAELEAAENVNQPPRKSRKRRVRRVVEEQLPPSKRPPTPAKEMPPPRMTLRPLLVSQDHKGSLSNADLRDMFYALMDGITDVKRKLDRIEDTVHKNDDRLRSLEQLMLLKQEKQKIIPLPQPATGCPAVPPTRYCEVCYQEGHQASKCRSKSRMDPAHVEEVYKQKGICRKCHCIHPL
ncbi:hypothetical protein Y032_0009g674 [Ancylostoma ceylanicum]|uniref:Uncharacterized protein n=1 Tax=Ancylostoma ceylanicum TaxID=53326 RepID=A0A016VKR1_9BILA|nr:hypothetical protein Y032_0009g674 [Ancylostoma ceylanicum]